MNAPLAIAFALCVGVTGCTSPAASTGAARILPAGNPAAAIAIGRTTKADLIAALGSTATVVFESGFEVWIYRLDGPGEAGAGNGEFVILVAPTGIVAKTRLRRPPGPAPGARLPE